MCAERKAAWALRGTASRRGYSQGRAFVGSAPSGRGRDAELLHDTAPPPLRDSHLDEIAARDPPDDLAPESLRRQVRGHLPNLPRAGMAVKDMVSQGRAGA